MVHFHGGGVGLAALPVGYDQIAGEVFRHAVFVVIHVELFEGYAKRQFLHQEPVARVEKHFLYGLSFADVHIAAKR